MAEQPTVSFNELKDLTNLVLGHYDDPISKETGIVLKLEGTSVYDEQDKSNLEVSLAVEQATSLSMQLATLVMDLDPKGASEAGAQILEHLQSIMEKRH